MRQKDQKMRYSDAELSLMKNTFAGDDIYLYALRKFMLGMELTEGEQNIINLFNDEIKSLIKKIFMPEIDGDAPLFQLVDMQMALREEIKNKSRDEIKICIEAKQLEIDYIQSRINKLNGIETDIITSSLKDMANLNDDNVIVNITARNYLLSYIDSFCNEIKILAGKKEDSVEKTLEEIRKNSTK